MVIKISYDEFKEFYDKHPDLDNAEYYAEFENINKSTVRSWKSRAWKEQNPESTPEPTKANDKDYSALEEEHIKLLIKEARADPKEFEGLDNKSIILLLKNRIAMRPEPKRSATGSILPQPLPASKTKKAFGIDEFMEFDKDKGEIRMQIPMDYILDPEKNKKLGLLK